MITFGKDYFYHEGKVYREVKPDQSRKTPRWKLKDKKGNYHWVTKQQLEQIIQQLLNKTQQ